MTNQAINSMALYKGNSPAKILQMLTFQKKSVVKELMDHFKAKDMSELSVKLSVGE